MGENPRVRVAAVIVKNEEILLVRHEKKGHTYWLLPGGGVDFGETLPQALIREVKEETNLNIEVGRQLFISDAIHPQRERHIINVYFEAVVTGEKLQVAADERLKEARFVKLDQLRNLVLYPNIKEELIQSQNGQAKFPAYLGQRWEEING